MYVNVAAQHGARPIKQRAIPFLLQAVEPVHENAESEAAVLPAETDVGEVPTGLGLCLSARDVLHFNGCSTRHALQRIVPEFEQTGEDLRHLIFQKHASRLHI